MGDVVGRWAAVLLLAFGLLVPALVMFALLTAGME